MIVKTPIHPTIKGISGGKPARNKKKDFLSKQSITGGSAPSHGRRIPTPKKRTKLPVFTPWKVALASFLIGICGIFYIGHIFNTQQAFQEVNQLEVEYNKAQRLYNEKRLTYDRLTGPKEIYQQARQQGFVNAGPADQILYIQSQAK